MAIRDGMIDLIRRVRALTNAGTVEYTINNTDHWSDQQIQDILDYNNQFVVDARLHYLSQQIDGTQNYIVSQSVYRDWEQAASGTARWIVRDSTGAEYGTANYTANYRSGQVTFSTDRGGTAYFVTGYTYDVHAAAADVWLERMANFNDWYDFAADNQRFNRSQAWEHANKMEQRMRAKAGANVVGTSGDVRTAQFVRVDIR